MKNTQKTGESSGPVEPVREGGADPGPLSLSSLRGVGLEEKCELGSTRRAGARGRGAARAGQRDPRGADGPAGTALHTLLHHDLPEGQRCARHGLDTTTSVSPDTFPNCSAAAPQVRELSPVRDKVEPPGPTLAPQGVQGSGAGPGGPLHPAAQGALLQGTGGRLLISLDDTFHCPRQQEPVDYRPRRSYIQEPILFCHPSVRGRNREGP